MAGLKREDIFLTSHVILQKLGVDDYGIYQAVGGVVGFRSFINGALATGSSRFLTYALDEGNAEKLKRTFSTTLNIHILMAIVGLVQKPWLIMKIVDYKWSEIWGVV